MQEFITYDGETLYYKAWKAEEPQAVIQILTGLAEVSEYYEAFAASAVRSGFSVYLLEYRKHGRSTASYGEGNLFINYARDQALFLRMIRREEPGRKVFVMSHSLGTMVTQMAFCHTDARWDGVIMMGLSHNAYTEEKRRKQLSLAEAAIEKYGPDAMNEDIYEEVFNHLNDRFAAENSPFSFITSDRNKWEWIASLPYTSPGYSNRFFKEFVEAWSLLETCGLETYEDHCLAVLILNGSEDVTADLGTYGDAKLDLLERAGFEDVESAVYEGLRHSLLQESLADIITEDILTWAGEHL